MRLEFFVREDKRGFALSVCKKFYYIFKKYTFMLELFCENPDGHRHLFPLNQCHSYC